MSITFETKTWENDWGVMLKTPRISEMIRNCGYAFDERILYINNVRSRSKVEKAADRLVQKGVLTEFVCVEDYANDALDYFGLTRDELGKGYYYSIAELVSIYRAKTDFILHFSSDSEPQSSQDDWLDVGMRTLREKKDVAVFNLCWNERYDAARSESAEEDELCCYGYGFSDQMYLVRANDFKNRIYHYSHPASERYPDYGGELFEKRVDSWMRTMGQKRATFMHSSYVHKNFPKTRYGRFCMRIKSALRRGA
ncbi:hypothetical protein GGQ74_002831 [Desulfobaculum xiamenense]|uniref:Glycosyl transferase family 2 n=1 Tax=Desulfobaculum xiamenense TaxID=995050 RepID=A0A846QPN1_9BACT|nr:hypothetical protein [Desulfobaculum xiamenense]NJB69137.1 hypothetical protein [Desulfobaculum xiamenense]